MMKKQRAPNKLIPEDIGEYLEYNSETGYIKWIKRPHIRSSVKSGDLAGCKSKDGYRQIRFKNSTYKEHRIAWFLFYNEDVNSESIDHINGIRNDNKISNLRKLPHNHQSLNLGKLGYHWRKDRQCFVSTIRCDGKLKNIGHSYCPLIARIKYIEYHNAKYPNIPITTLLPRNSTIIGRPDFQILTKGDRNGN